MAGTAAARVWTFNPEKWENYKNPSLSVPVPYTRNEGQHIAAAMHARPEQEKEVKILEFERKEDRMQEEKVQDRFRAGRASKG